VRIRLFALTALVGLAGGASALAADPVYLGSWKFTSAVVAPWADPAQKPDPAEKNSLMGKTVAIKPREIVGPKVFACKGPKYKLTDYTADLLFQGAFEEMRDRDESADPARLAASLGFTGTSFKTLETGCEIDWHFVDSTTVKVGLNDYVYTLKRQ
jgi:hypothetical protein